MQTRTTEADDADGGRFFLNPLAWIRMAMADVAQLARFRSALVYIVRSNLKIRYQRSTLGFLWTLLNPLLMIVVLAIVFSTLMNRPLRSFTVYLFAGLLPWQLFNVTVVTGASSLIRNESLLRRIYVPKLLFPVAVILESSVNMLLAMAALFLLLLAIGMSINTQLVLLPAAVVLLGTLTLGLTLMLMVLTTFYRDIEHMVQVLFRAWYFATPILYERQLLDRSRIGSLILACNPMTYILEIFHCMFCSEGPGWPRWPSVETWCLATAFAFGCLFLGYSIYRVCERKLVFRL